MRWMVCTPAFFLACNIELTHTALVVYEFLITSGDEWTLIWRRKMTGSSLLFIANRLIMIVSIIDGSIPSTADVRMSLHLIARYADMCRRKRAYSHQQGHLHVLMQVPRWQTVVDDYSPPFVVRRRSWYAAWLHPYESR